MTATAMRGNRLQPWPWMAFEAWQTSNHTYILPRVHTEYAIDAICQALSIAKKPYSQTKQLFTVLD